MLSPLEVLTFPPRAAAQLFNDGRQRAESATKVGDAAVRIAADIAHLTRDIALISSNIAGLRQEIGTLGADVAGVRQEIGGVAASVEHVQSSLEHVRSSLNDVQTELHDDLTPVAIKLDETSSALAALDHNVTAVTAPLRPAAERAGRLAQTVPGKTKAG